MMSKVASITKFDLTKNQITLYMEDYKPLTSEFVVSLEGDKSSSQKVLRDTGATQFLILDSVLPLTENSFTYLFIYLFQFL